MKKLVVFLVMAVMMFSLVGTAFAADFADVKDLDQNAQASIAKLTALNVIEGYPDGSFKPGNTITRAEFAKIAIVLGGLEKSADVLKNSSTKFKDVAAGQWYTGWINLAESQGYVKGYPDGTFRPNAPISYNEVITVFLRVLGYNDNLPGPWPVDYIAKAGALGVTEDITFDAKAAATRVDVVVMANAALDCDVVKWNADEENFVDKSENKTTLLKQNFDTAVNEDYRVTSVTHDDGVWSINVNGTDEAGLNGSLDIAESCIIANGSLPIDLGGKIVDFLYNADDKKIVYLEVTSTTVTADGEDWSYNAGKKEFKIDDVKYDAADYFIGDPYNRAFEEDEDGDLVPVGAAGYDGNAYYRASINSDKEVYMVAKVNAGTPAIVEAFEDGELTVKDEGTYGAYDDIEGIDFEEDTVLIKKDGAFVSPDELKANHVIYVTANSYGYDYYIEVAGTINKTGTLDAVKTDGGNAKSVRIDGTWYDVAAYNLLSNDEGENFNETITAANLDDSDDETITYFLNKSNQVCFIITGEVGEGSKIYGVVIDLGYKIAKDKGVTKNMINEITVLKADGTEVTFKVDTGEVELYDEAGGLDCDEFIKFSVNEDNEIDSLAILAQLDGHNVVDPEGSANDFIGNIKDGDDDNNRLKFNNTWYSLNDSTVIFNAGEAIDDDAAVINNDDLIDWAAELTDPGVTAYVQYTGTKVEYIYVNADVTSATSVDYALVLDKYTKGGKTWVEVDVNGKTENYEVKSGSPELNYIYDYSISSNKFSVSEGDVAFNPESVVEGTYHQVAEVDRVGNGVRLEDGTWLYADKDTVIYDYTDYYATNDDPVYASSVKAISKGDYIVYMGEANGVDMFVIVTNITAEDVVPAPEEE